MLYVRTRNKEHIPLGWEEVEFLFKRLHRLAYVSEGAYQLEWERRMFTLEDHPEMRLTLVKWNRYMGAGEVSKREEVATAYHPSEMVPVLLMLVAIAEDKLKELQANGEISNDIKWA